MHHPLRTRCLVAVVAFTLCALPGAARGRQLEFRHVELELPGPPAKVIPPLLTKSRVTAMPIQLSHGLRVAELPQHHRDPFDRLLVAQAQLEQLPIVTADPQIARYDVTVIEA